MKLTKLTDEEIGLIEWESPVLDMRFVDDYKDEVDALLQAQIDKIKRENGRNDG